MHNMACLSKAYSAPFDNLLTLRTAFSLWLEPGITTIIRTDHRGDVTNTLPIIATEAAVSTSFDAYGLVIS